MTELVWRVVGYDTKQMRNDSQLYCRDTALQAEAVCRQLHPHFDVYYVQRVEEFAESYYERIYKDGERIAFVTDNYDKYCFFVHKDQFVYKDYATVADAKEALFRIYPEFN